MNESWMTVLCVALVTAGVLAELNLLRIFVGDWVRGRREGRRPSSREVRRTGGTSNTERTPMVPPLALCVLLLPGATAVAQDSGDAGSAQAAGDAAPVRLSLAEARLSFTLQPQASDAPPAPALDSQELTISTNRPSFNDTAGIVPIGHFQLETGYTFTFRDRDEVETQTHNGPELLGRIPLLEDRLELQLGTSGYVWSRSNGGSGFESSEGFSDMTVGVRLKVADQDEWLPRIALQATTTTGLGSDGISNQDFEPTFKFIWSYDLGDGWGVYGNLGVGYLTTGSERFVQGQAGVCLSKTLNDEWSVYAEYYVFGPNSKGSDEAHYIDVGAAYLLTPRIQLDGRVGCGLNEEANNVFTGFGISFLF